MTGLAVRQHVEALRGRQGNGFVFSGPRKRHLQDQRWQPSRAQSPGDCPRICVSSMSKWSTNPTVSSAGVSEPVCFDCHVCLPNGSDIEGYDPVVFSDESQA
jgi:hypothetical protein